jgi:hypothetical protein
MVTFPWVHGGRLEVILRTIQPFAIALEQPEKIRQYFANEADLGWFISNSV